MDMTKETPRTINIFSNVEHLKIDTHAIQKLFWLLDDFIYPAPPGELSVAFLNEKDMRHTHEQFLQDDTLTDVITFPGAPLEAFGGEICVSPDYASQSCVAHQTSFSDELTLYLVHGYLHLHGLDDHTEEDIRAMRKGEKECMDFLKSKNLVPMFIYGLHFTKNISSL